MSWNGSLRPPQSRLEHLPKKCIPPLCFSVIRRRRDYICMMRLQKKELDIRGTEHLKTHRGSDTTNSELYTTDILRNALNVKSEQLSAGRSIEEMTGKCEAEEQQECTERLVSVRDAIRRSGPERKKSHRPLHGLWRHASDPERRRWQIVPVRPAGCAKKEGNQRRLLLCENAFGGIRAKTFCEQYTRIRRECQQQ